jgi:hypothetical protein|tara:strand:- start:200 stop:562 length:363 start_codon:yes stop_codon:yes gene_type:complete
MRVFTYLFAIAGLLLLGSCDKEDNTSDVTTELPAIDSLTTSMTIMQFGSTKPAVLNCFATGGDLTYIWEVDLGDLFVINDSGSQAQYSASPCCIGEKTINCTVSNNKGEVSKSIIVTITE